LSKGEQTKQNILNASLKLFAIKGYEETSLSEIAQIVGIKTPSIYGHFSSKENLFKSLVDHVTESYLEFTQTIFNDIESLSTEEKLYMLLKKVNAYSNHEDFGLFLKKYFFIPPEQFEDLFIQKSKKVDEEIKTFIRSVIKEHDGSWTRDEETIVETYLCLLDGTFFYMVNRPAELYEKRLKSAWEVFWNGITN
jgi:AcrR family transcriptional regulator